MNWVILLLSFPLQVAKWLWNMSHAARLRMQLEAELAHVRDLRRLERDQRRDLTASLNQRLTVIVQSITYDVDERVNENAVRITLMFFNLTVFQLRLSNFNWRGTFTTGGKRGDLVQVANISDLPQIIYPCGKSSATIVPAVAEKTATDLDSIRNSHDRIHWQFTLRAEAKVGGEVESHQGTWDLTYDHVPR